VLRPYLELMRPANVVTALADVLAGFAVAGLGNWSGLPWLLGGSACLYAGGVVLNDLLDRFLDARERPERPLPSGRAGVAQAAWLAVGLLAMGVIAAAQATAAAGAVALAIALGVMAYDSWSKHHAILGPVNMGLCRGLNLTLGMAAVPAVLPDSWPLALIPLVYVAGVTTLSRGEVSGGTRRPAVVAVVLVAGALVALARVSLGSASAVAGLALTAVLAWRAWLPALSALRDPSPQVVRAAVRRGVLSLVLLDAAIAAAYAGVGYSVVLLATALLAGWLARAFAVT
jgi:4-hydroxybenzoate polyprenyltransferase